MTELVPVRVRDCACPDSPHGTEGDLVYLLPTLTMDGGILAEQQMLENLTDTDRLKRLWLRTFTEHGAVAWNLLDAEGEPVPFDLDVIFADWTLARPVADKAADLYGDAVIAPLAATPSLPTATGPTTSTTSRQRRRTPSSSV